MQYVSTEDKVKVEGAELWVWHEGARREIPGVSKMEGLLAEGQREKAPKLPGSGIPYVSAGPRLANA